MPDVVAVEALQGHRLRLRFEDGAEGEVDISKLVPLDSVFAPLRDRARFLEVAVHTDLGTIYWPNGADLDPDVLYAAVTGCPLEAPEPVRTR